jgi:photosystem II stability/assembly factor-like uncharacterized protein
MIALTFPDMAIAQANPDLLNAMKWREIGPWRGGRVTTVTGVRGQPQLYYMGATGGGVWRTVNGGTSWENLSDKHFKVGTIGAVSVAPSDPNVLYVGTGESPIRGVTTSSGDGLWKSTDAGKTWTHIGLPDAGQVSRIKIHPEDPDAAWVAVQGNIWGPSETRGVFKTTDGGQSWRHVLKVNPDTGAADLVLDPGNPRILYAAMWHHGRTPWFIKSGGEGGGIYKSTDGGENWNRLTKGLPDPIGKIGIDVPASNPSRVYAIVEAELGKGGLYVSDNAGASWKLVNGRRVLHSRAWYYNHITADPTDENTVWVQNVPLMKSIDGGKTFNKVSVPHGDIHDHWINPENPLNMINGNDGGATVTFDGGKTWSSIRNQPTSQFYRVITDNQQPFRIYGGQQDYSTLAIASESRWGGIGFDDQFGVGGGESAHIAFDEDNPRLIYATSINNTLSEYDHENGLYRSIVPYPEHVFGKDARDLRYRTNWNAPVIVSPHDPTVIYYGTQKLLKSTDRGANWQEISPDLTRNEAEKQGRNGGPLTPENVGAEYYNTIFYITESPHEKGTLWVGADDGLVHLSRNGGESWDNVTPGNAPEGMVNAIEVSPHNPGTMYFPLARYKLNDSGPYIYRTDNYGGRWKRIDDGLPEDSFVRVVREDPNQEGLLYAGTETGLFVSFNGGEDWKSMQMNLPPVPITDLTIRHDKLVASTQGRGFWVLDDLALVRQMDADIDEKALHVFTPTNQRLGRPGGSPRNFEGTNPPRGLVLHYALDTASEEPLSIEILDEQGELVRSYSSKESDFDRCRLTNMDLRSPFKLKYPGTAQGLNAWTWDLRGKPLKCIEDARMYAGFGGARVTPGQFQARISIGDASETVDFEIEPDPRIQASAEQEQAWVAATAELSELFNEIATAIQRSRSARARIEELAAEHPAEAELQTNATAAIESLSDWEAQVTQLKFDTYEDEDSWPPLIDGMVRNLLNVIDGSGPPVSAGALERKADLEELWGGHREAMNAITGQHIEPLNAWAREQGVEHVPTGRN